MPSFMNSALFLLAVPALLLQGAQGLRGSDNTLSTEVSTDKGSIRGRRQLQDWDPTWGFYIGKCVGTACGGFGDPHLITCDGLFYDCMGLGIFTVMQNELFNMQATFIDVGPEALVGTESWLTQGASMTNDFMIHYTPEEGTDTILQFGVGDVVHHDGTYPAEEGCDIYTYYHEYIDYSIEPNVESCREGCQARAGEGCTKFSYWYDGYCFYHDDWATMYETSEGWSRVVSGDLDESTCGTLTPEEEQLMTDEENAKATRLGMGCPLLMFVNGTMIDISDVFYEGDLYGKDDDDIHVELLYGFIVHVTYKLAENEYAVVELFQAGAGLGQPWGCHFDFWICLPETDKEMWIDTTTGLLGSPDNNYENDWMKKDGTTIELDMFFANTQEEYDQSMIDYCYDNWCVGQDESLMTYHGDQTYEDYKCENEEFIDWKERDCVLTADKIFEVCREMPPLMMHACEVDCCFGGCDQIEEVAEQIEELREFSDEDEERILFDTPNFDKCRDDFFEDTSDSICEGFEAVTLLRSTGSEELPDGEIFFGINIHSEPSTDVGHRTVRFKVNNPFNDNADVYVRYDKAVMDDMADPHCDQMLDTASGCDPSAIDIEVMCREFDGVDPFAVVEIFFVSESISIADSPAVDKCCKPEEYGDNVGTVSYIFEVACGCPSVAIQ